MMKVKIYLANFPTYNIAAELDHVVGEVINMIWSYPTKIELVSLVFGLRWKKAPPDKRAS